MAVTLRCDICNKEIKNTAYIGILQTHILEKELRHVFTRTREHVCSACQLRIEDLVKTIRRENSSPYIMNGLHVMKINT